MNYIDKTLRKVTQDKTIGIIIWNIVVILGYLQENIKKYKGEIHELL